MSPDTSAWAAYSVMRSHATARFVGADDALRHSGSSRERVLCEADSGDELARSNVFPKMTTGILVTLGFGGLQYDLSAEGHIIGLEVVPTPATASPSPSPSGG